MRKEFEMSQEDLDKLMEAFKPVPMIALQCGPIPSVQERANAAWNELGDKMGFVGITAKPISKGERFFTAEVKTTLCNLCGEPMPEGEEMFKFHGYSGPCPATPPKYSYSEDGKRATLTNPEDMLAPKPPLPPHAALLFEAYDSGQFADDFNQPLALPIRAAIRQLLDDLLVSAKS